MKSDRNYQIPCCPCCGEECHVCTHEKVYIDDNGEYVIEDENEN